MPEWRPPETPKVAVIGAGTMGGGIALFFAARGLPTVLIDPNEAARERFRAGMKESIERLEGDPAAARLTLHASLAGADWQGVGLVIESIVEELPQKRACFAELEKRAPAGALLATNSTGYPIAAIAAGLASASRMIGLHFLMPAQFVPLVEIIPSEATSEEAVIRLRELMAALGKRAVVVRKPLIGFLANRMQSALMREALSLIDRGVATPEDVDAAVRYGFGFRYAAAGPILQKEHSGWDISFGLYEKVFPDLCNDAAPTPSLRAMIEAERFGMKKGRGFFDWSDDEEVARERARFEEALNEVSKVLRG